MKKKRLKPKSPPLTSRRAPAKASSPSSAPSNKPERVVAVGASAGGLESIEGVFRDIPNQSGTAFVLIQHLSPDFKSFMPEILARKTGLRIVAITEDLEIEPDTIYLLPAHVQGSLAGNRFRLLSSDPNRVYNKPIDIFFRSLAEQWRDKAVGIVLSGSGNDGTEGIAEIRRWGGKVMAENPRSARFDSMPRCAIATGFVDFIGTPEEIAAELMGRKPNAAEKKDSHIEANGAAETTLDKILHLVQRKYGVDFSLYKVNTVSRRLANRIQILGVQTESNYLTYLEQNPEEVSNLYYEMLIGVTQFFRDHDAFEILKERVIPKLLKDREEGSEVRIWVPGCASGEEVYSLAVLFFSCAESLNKKFDFRIFASDIDDEILAIGSLGKFSQPLIETSLPSEYVEKYFVPLNGAYQIQAYIRKSIVFARHNLLTDPPFNKMDFVSCRNLLIYLGDEAQRRALSVFYFSLNPDGILFLGPSESLGRYESGYEVMDRKWKIYRKASRGVPREIQLVGHKEEKRSPLYTHPLMRQSRGDSSRLRSQEVTMGFEALMQAYVPSSILVNELLDMLHIFGDIGKYLRQRPGPPSVNLKDLLEERIGTSIMVAIQRAKSSGSPVSYSGFTAHDGTEDKPIEILVRPLAKKNDRKASLFLISISERAVPKSGGKRAEKFRASSEVSDQISFLEKELQESRENLQSTIEELETTNEELQSTNEELMSSNEELQSTNEELHSVNEELHTVNAEYQNKIEELTTLSHDEQNLFLNIELGVIFLDKQLNIRKFTSEAGKSFNILPSDIGRPLQHLKHNIQIENLDELTSNVLHTGKQFEKQVSDANGNHYLLRVRPYSSDNKITGVVLTFVDITQWIREQKRWQQQEVVFRSTVNAAPAAIAVIKRNGEIFLVNRECERFFGYRKEELMGTPVSRLIPPEIQEKARANFEEFLKKPHALHLSEPTFGLDKKGAQIPLDLQISPFSTPGEKFVMLAAIDRTPLVKLEKKIEEYELRLDRIIQSINDSVWEWNTQTGDVWFSPRFYTLLGIEPKDFAGRLEDWLSLVHPEDRPSLQERLRFREVNGKAFKANVRLRRQTGDFVWCELRTEEDTGRAGTLVSGALSDVHDQKIVEETLIRSNVALEEFAYVTSHDLKAPLRHLRAYVDVMKTELKKGNWGEVEKAMAIVDGSASRMADLVGGLLSVSQIRNERFDPVHTPMSELAASVVELLVPEARECAAEIVVHPLPALKLDPRLVKQVLQNLLQNALKFRRPGQPPKIEIGAEEQVDSWEFFVKDNGIGIDPKYGDKVFQIFQRLNDEESYAGTGIGLAIAKKIVELHGGKIWLKALPGQTQGTTFHFTISKRLERRTDHVVTHS